MKPKKDFAIPMTTGDTWPLKTRLLWRKWNLHLCHLGFHLPFLDGFCNKYLLGIVFLVYACAYSIKCTSGIHANFGEQLTTCNGCSQCQFNRDNWSYSVFHCQLIKYSLWQIRDERLQTRTNYISYILNLTRVFQIS